MAAPLDQGPSPEHTHGRMVRLIAIVTEMDTIELKLEAMEAALQMRIRTMPRPESANYSYRCPKCAGITEVARMLRSSHHHICPLCCEIVSLEIILHPQTRLQVADSA